MAGSVQLIAAYKHTAPINRNTGHAKCRPRDAMSAIAPVVKNVTARIVDKLANDIARSASSRMMAAKPHHAIVVRCQANLSVLIVKSALPKIFGKSSRRKRRLRIYRSPSTECKIPMPKANEAAMYSNVVIPPDRNQRRYVYTVRGPGSNCLRSSDASHGSGTAGVPRLLRRAFD